MIVQKLGFDDVMMMAMIDGQEGCNCYCKEDHGDGDRMYALLFVIIRS